MEKYSISKKANMLMAFPFIFLLVMAILAQFVNITFEVFSFSFFGAIFFAMLGQLFFRCPNCGKNVFVRKLGNFPRIGSVPSIGLALPWSEQKCSECKTDLTIGKELDD